MTDPVEPAPVISAAAAERLAALRQPSNSKKRTKPAHTSKVLSAGISTTALLGMIAGMGWQTSTGSAQTTAQPIAAPTSVAPTLAPLAPTPTTATPVTPVPVVPVPTIPAAVPAAQVPVQNNAGGNQSNTTTKSSG